MFEKLKNLFKKKTNTKVYIENIDVNKLLEQLDKVFDSFRLEVEKSLKNSYVQYDKDDVYKKLDEQYRTEMNKWLDSKNKNDEIMSNLYQSKKESIQNNEKNIDRDEYNNELIAILQNAGVDYNIKLLENCDIDKTAYDKVKNARIEAYDLIWKDITNKSKLTTTNEIVAAEIKEEIKFKDKTEKEIYAIYTNKADIETSSSFYDIDFLNIQDVSSIDIKNETLLKFLKSFTIRLLKILPETYRMKICNMRLSENGIELDVQYSKKDGKKYKILKENDYAYIQHITTYFIPRTILKNYCYKGDPIGKNLLQ